MITKEELKKQLKDLGIKCTDRVVIHTSMKAIGEVEDGVDTVIKAFLEYLEDGLFIVPTHTWKNVNGTQPIFDRALTPSCIGLIPNQILKYPEAIRSLHPTHSIAVAGKGAEEFIKGEEFCTTPTPIEGCWGRLYDIGAKILLIGVGHERNTFLHSVEERFDVPNRLSREPSKLEIYDNGVFIKDTLFHKHSHPKYENMSDRFIKFEDPFHKLGGVSYGEFGCAKVKVCDAIACNDIMIDLWKKADYDLTEDFTEIPKDWY